MKSLFFSFLLHLRDEFADAFDYVSINADESYHISRWDNGIEWLNSAYLKDFSRENMYSLVETLQLNVIFTPTLVPDLNVDGVFSLFTRSKQKIDAPIMVEENIVKYSFEDREMIFKIRKTVNEMLRMQPDIDTDIFEKYYGGLLHLFNGSIYSVEGEDDKKYAMMLVYQYQTDSNSVLMIEDIVSPLQQGTEYKSLLLQHVLAQSKADLAVIIIENEDQKIKILDNFNFEKTEIINRYKLSVL